MEPYTEKELINFATYIVNKTLETNKPDGVQDAWLCNWKEKLIEFRRNEKIEQLLNDN